MNRVTERVPAVLIGWIRFRDCRRCGGYFAPEENFRGRFPRSWSACRWRRKSPERRRCRNRCHRRPMPSAPSQRLRHSRSPRRSRLLYFERVSFLLHGASMLPGAASFFVKRFVGRYRSTCSRHRGRGGRRRRNRTRGAHAVADISTPASAAMSRNLPRSLR
jgi:hypothetical protein